MNLIFIYGAPAVGKLTVAKELAHLTGYKLFHNHLVLDLVMSLFDWSHPERKGITRKIRLDLAIAAARNNVSFITTFGNTAQPTNSSFIDEYIESVESNGGIFHLVHLYCSQEEMMRRVEAEDRKKYKKLHTKEELQRKLDTEITDVKAQFSQKPGISIDTTHLSPNETAQKIASELRLI
jgi:deoxyadenosine/deoxycytidine kinase